MSTAEPNLVLRTARVDDVSRMQEIALRAWAPIFRGCRECMGEELYELEKPGDHLALKADEVSNFYNEHADWCLVDQIGIQVVGFITSVLHRDRGVGEIGNNAVNPDYQERGIGVAQCQRVLEIFRQEGMKCAKVHTGLDPAHAPARAMYEKVGFVPMIPHVEYYLKLQTD